MKISIGFDHGAIALRKPVLEFLQSSGHEVIDHGTDTTDSVDYPDYAKCVAGDVASGTAEAGILCCTTGIGMSMAANKVKGVRAAVVHFEDEAALTRRHNNANVLCMGALHTSPELAQRLVEVFLSNSFEGGRHQRRVDKFSDWESSPCS
ncbi:MAG: ribose 5-phosphate isomerase B [Puniceicoccaceae bacterium]